MSTDKGYVKVYRDVREHWIWSAKPFSPQAAWVDLIMRASHEKKEITFNGQLLTIEKGSFITSIKRLAEEWGWSRHRVTDFLKLLQQEEMVSFFSDNKKTTIKLEKYCTYQDSQRRSRTSKGHQKDIRRTSKGHNQDTIKSTIEDTIKNIENSLPDEEPGEPFPDGYWDGGDEEGGT